MRLFEKSTSNVQPSLFVALTGTAVMEDQATAAFTALLKSQMLPLLPREVTRTRELKILDIACGEGEWVNSLGFELDDPTRGAPGGEVCGIDMRPHRIAHAQAQARARHLENVSFLVDDPFQMNVADEAYDLVHVRGLAFSVAQDRFPALLEEALRVLRPGGTLICAEFAWPRTHARNCLILASLVRQVLKAVNYASIRVDQLAKLLCAAGCTLVRERVTTINLSAETEGNWLLTHRFFPLLYFLPPLLTQQGIMDEQQFLKLLHDLEVEIRMQTFRAEWPLITVIGEKPL